MVCNIHAYYVCRKKCYRMTEKCMEKWWLQWQQHQHHKISTGTIRNAHKHITYLSTKSILHTIAKEFYCQKQPFQQVFCSCHLLFLSLFRFCRYCFMSASYNISAVCFFFCISIIIFDCVCVCLLCIDGTISPQSLICASLMAATCLTWISQSWNNKYAIHYHHFRTTWYPDTHTHTPIQSRYRSVGLCIDTICVPFVYSDTIEKHNVNMIFVAVLILWLTTIRMWTHAKKKDQTKLIRIYNWGHHLCSPTNRSHTFIVQAWVVWIGCMAWTNTRKDKRSCGGVDKTDRLQIDWNRGEA